MTRAIKLFGYQIWRKLELKNGISCHTKTLAKLNAELQTTFKKTERARIEDSIARSTKSIEIYTNGLREIAANKQGIQNVKDIPLGQFLNEVA